MELLDAVVFAGVCILIFALALVLYGWHSSHQRQLARIQFHGDARILNTLLTKRALLVAEQTDVTAEVIHYDQIIRRHAQKMGLDVDFLLKDVSR